MTLHVQTITHWMQHPMVATYSVPHLLFALNFYFGQNIKILTWADWNYELALLVIGPKTSHIEGQKDFLSG